MEGNHLESNNEKQVFLSESEELSKDDPPADFDISIEELTAKLAEKKKDNKIVEEKLKAFLPPILREQVQAGGSRRAGAPVGEGVGAEA